MVVNACQRRAIDDRVCRTSWCACKAEYPDFASVLTAETTDRVVAVGLYFARRLGLVAMTVWRARGISFQPLCSFSVSGQFG
jgi:hypothetical protein